MADPVKRQLRDADAQRALERTTSDIYGEKHGIPQDIQAALQNVGRRNRMMVSQNQRSFQPSQSMPAFPSSSGIFISDADAQAAARLIVKDDLRRRELQPFSSLSSTDALSLSPRAQAHELNSPRLHFNADGEVVEPRGFKRTGSSVSNASDGGNASSVNFALSTTPFTRVPSAGVAHPFAANAPSNADFPPVFKSAQVSVPELAGGQAQAVGSMGPPPLPAGRDYAGLPRRQLRPTMSAPVGRLGSQQGGLRGFMEVEEEEEDGFDVDDWEAEQEGEDKSKDVATWAKSDAF